MKLMKTVFLAAGLWTLGISALHAWLNLDLFRPAAADAGKTFKVGFLPVT